MPTTDVPYDRLSPFGAQTGGTWAHVSSPVGASPPAAPGAYNGTIDFAGEPVGEYVYSYTTTAGSATDVKEAIYQWNGTLASRTNDTCAGAEDMGTPSIIPFNLINDFQSNAEDCDNLISAPSDSGESKPASWGAGPFLGEDLWYKLRMPSNTIPYQVSVRVDGSSFGTRGVYKPCLAVYDGAVSDTCGSKVIQNSSLGQYQDTYVGLTIGPVEQIIWIRVASYTAGQFNIFVTVTA